MMEERSQINSSGIGSLDLTLVKSLSCQPCGSALQGKFLHRLLSPALNRILVDCDHDGNHL